MKQYRVTKKFISSILEGLTHTSITAVQFNVGYTCNKPIGGSPYIITECEEV